MKLHTFVLVLLLAPLGAIAADPTEQSPDPYTAFISRVQEKLRALGFDAGPVNGDSGGKTQAALAQFQLANSLPASGQLDARTLAELGVARDGAPVAAGASADSATGATSDRRPDPSSASAPR